MSEQKYTLDAIREDWRLLDDESFPEIKNVKLISHEQFTGAPEIEVEYIQPGKVAKFFHKIPLVYFFFYAIRLFRSADARSVVIINGGVTLLWLWCGILNAFPIFGKKKLFCWDIFVEYILGKEKRFWFFPFIKLTTRKKEMLARFILRQYGLNVVWSKKQVATHAKHFNLPDHHFIFLPFKANHSKRETYDIPMSNFIFAGGNGKRDYKCLTDAVRGTGIPVIISATDPEVRKSIEPLPNVMIIGAPEPAFGQLQVASRFVVIPMIFSGIKGGGEANFCNAMWHRTPIIAVDSMSADDYVLDGVTGYVVHSGDSKALREKILYLWNDINLCRDMGLQGRNHVENNFTHSMFINRLQNLAKVFGVYN